VAKEKVEEQADTTAQAESEAEEEIAEVKAQIEDDIQEQEPAKEQTEEKAGADSTEQKTDNTDTNAPNADIEEKSATITESKMSAANDVSKSIEKMAQSRANLPGEPSLTALELCAEHVMQKELVWAGHEDSVQQTFAKMQQHDTNYMVVGREGKIEGIVSKSDLEGAISPYLRPMFAKWRRPMDDATLQIKIKWIMSRPVHIIKPQTPLAAIMKNMSRLHVHVLPVADQQGKILGLVTEDDIFKAILKPKNDPNIPTSDKMRWDQSTSVQSSHHTEAQPTMTSQPPLAPAEQFVQQKNSCIGHFKAFLARFAPSLGRNN